jgi:hypothetical protein
MDAMDRDRRRQSVPGLATASGVTRIAALEMLLYHRLVRRRIIGLGVGGGIGRAALLQAGRNARPQREVPTVLSFGVRTYSPSASPVSRSPKLYDRCCSIRRRRSQIH